MKVIIRHQNIDSIKYIVLMLTLLSCNSTDTQKTKEKPARRHLEQITDLMKKGLNGRVKKKWQGQILAEEKDGKLVYDTTQLLWNTVEYYNEQGFLTMIEHPGLSEETMQKKIYNYTDGKLASIDEYEDTTRTGVGYPKWYPPYTITTEWFYVHPKTKDTFRFNQYDRVVLDEYYQIGIHEIIYGRDSNRRNIRQSLYFNNNDLHYENNSLRSDTGNYWNRISVLEKDKEGNPIKQYLYWPRPSIEHDVIVTKYEYYE